MTTLRRLASILVRPSSVIEPILAAERDAAVLPLVSIALLSLFLREFSKPSFGLAIERSPASVVVTVAGVLCVVFAAALLVFFLFAAVVLLVGQRVFEGDGTARRVRSALAWSLAPEIWALVYRIPLAFRGGSAMSTFGTVLDVIAAIWVLAIVAFALAEALRFSPLSAMGTLLLSTLGPLVAIIGAALVVDH